MPGNISLSVLLRNTQLIAAVTIPSEQKIHLSCVLQVIRTVAAYHSCKVVLSHDFKHDTVFGGFSTWSLNNAVYKWKVPLKDDIFILYCPQTMEVLL